MRAFKPSTKSPSEMTPGQINAELEKLRKVRSALNDAFIDAGRGHETSEETYRLSDPLARQFNAVSARTHALINEIERRTGQQGSRMPKGFGPIGQRNRSGGTTTSYARELELWVFNNLAASLDQQFNSRVANLIARDASLAAKKRYLDLVKRGEVR